MVLQACQHAFSTAVNCKNCTSCHFAIFQIEVASLVHAKPVIDLPCEICRLPHDDHVMVLCDSCNRGYHIYCLKPPLTKAPPGIWVCSECSQSEVTTLTIETLWATDRFHRDVRRALEFMPPSGPHHKQRGWPRKTNALATITAQDTSVHSKDQADPRKLTTSPTFCCLLTSGLDLSLHAKVCLIGCLVSRTPPYLCSWTPCGGFFQSHFITAMMWTSWWHTSNNDKSLEDLLLQIRLCHIMLVDIV
jgi:hypothetical protein